MTTSARTAQDVSNVTRARIRLLVLGLLIPLVVWAASPTVDETPAGSINNTTTNVGFTSAASVADNSYIIGFVRMSGTSDVFNDDCTIAGGGSSGTLFGPINDGTNLFYATSDSNVDNGGAGTAPACTNSSAATTRTAWTVLNGVPTSSSEDGTPITGTFSSTTSVTGSSVPITYSDVKVVCAISVVTGQSSGVSPNNGETELVDYDNRLQIQAIDFASGGSYQPQWTLTTSSAGAYGCQVVKSTTSTLLSAGGAGSGFRGSFRGPFGGPL